MFAKTVSKSILSGALVILSFNLALAGTHIRHPKMAHRAYTHFAHHMHAAPFEDLNTEAMRPYQAYVGNGGYASVPHDPLIPLRREVPPPVDPNEPASGSYGAMLAGGNAGTSSP